MVKYEININILVQLDLLIQLLESPIFAKLRLDLLDPVTNIYLFKCLYGLLMLLPQSNSFKILQNRLNSVSSIANLPFAEVSKTEIPNRKPNDEKYNDGLLDYFNQCQEKLQHLKLDPIENGKNGDIDDNISASQSGENDISNKFAEIFQNDQPLETSSIVS